LLDIVPGVLTRLFMDRKLGVFDAEIRQTAEIRACAERYDRDGECREQSAPHGSPTPRVAGRLEAARVDLEEIHSKTVLVGRRFGFFTRRSLGSGQDLFFGQPASVREIERVQDLGRKNIDERIALVIFFRRRECLEADWSSAKRAEIHSNVEVSRAQWSRDSLRSPLDAHYPPP
jgi:hypothetical protein